MPYLPLQFLTLALLVNAGRSPWSGESDEAGRRRPSDTPRGGPSAPPTPSWRLAA
jgi:hypothetical protein